MGQARRWVLAAMLAIGLAGVPAGVMAAPPQAAETPALLDPAATFYGCGLGAAVGALTVAFPPMASWARAGALQGMGAVLMRSGLGCYYGVLGGVVYSSVRWARAKVQSGLQAVF